MGLPRCYEGKLKTHKYNLKFLLDIMLDFLRTENSTAVIMASLRGTNNL